MTENERQYHAALDNRRKRIMVNFVEATRELLQAEGVDGLSIRKIANEAGYNSATMYNYFRDLEHLTLFGSVCYLREYVLALANSITPDMNALERFRTIYRCFNSFAFRYPDIFHNMFFGRYCDMLEDVLQTYYYELFPEELSGVPDSIRQMMVNGSMQKRDRVTIDEMVREGFIAAEKADALLDVIAALHQNFIYEAAIYSGSIDVKQHEVRFNQLFEYLLETAK